MRCGVKERNARRATNAIVLVERREVCCRGAAGCKKSFINQAIFLDTEFHQIYTFVSCNFAVAASMFNR